MRIRPAGTALGAALLLPVLLGGCAEHPAPGTAAAPVTAVASAPGGRDTASPLPGGTAGQASARSAPVRLRIPEIGVDTPLVRLGLQSDGSVQVPPVAAHAPAGWYQGSPAPGQVGPAVLLGHVTVGRYGDGVFLRLAELRTGARVSVTLADGTEVAFSVYKVRTVAKDRFPTNEVYGNVDRPELRLITCGGPRTAEGYRDNVVVFAVRT